MPVDTFSNVAAFVCINLGKLLPDGLRCKKIKVDITKLLSHVTLAMQRLPELCEFVEVDALVAVLVCGVDQSFGLRVCHLAPDLLKRKKHDKNLTTLIILSRSKNQEDLLTVVRVLFFPTQDLI